MKRLKTIETIDKTGKEVLIKGWVNVRRNMGKIAFLDVRDRWGIIQVVCVPQELDKASADLLADIRPEFVLEITGIVQDRGAKQINKDLVTGKIELLAKKINIINTA